MKVFPLALLACLAAPVWGTRGDNVCDGEEFEPLDVTNADSDATNIFDDLTRPEIKTVEDYMFAQEEFELKDAWTEGLDSAFIYIMETLPPPKQEALNYLDNNGPKPGKYVKVILYRSNLSPPVIEEYKVGPLAGELTHSIIKTVPWHMRNNIHWKQYYLIEDFLRGVLAPVNEMIYDITGYKFSNCTDNCLHIWTSGAGYFSNPATNQKIWINYLKAHLHGYYLHPVGFQVRVDTTSNDPSEWNVERYWWRGEHFVTLELLKTHLQNSNNNTPPPEYHNGPELFSSLHRRGEPLTDTPRRGPSTHMPDGRRYNVDGHHVKWQGWEFDFNIRTITGLQAHDIKFKGDRIAYEIALSEMMVIYSGEDPRSAHDVYYDSNYLFGAENYELIPGLDCPYHAEYFDFAHYVYGTSSVMKNSACVYEFDTGMPLRRHYESDYKGSYYFAHGMPGNALVLRTIATVWNYDYIVDFVFHQNGAMEIKWVLTGYVMSSWYVGEDGNKYSYEIAPNVVGSPHYHAANFKIDLDIQGTSNRFQTVDIKGKQEEDETEPGNMFWRQYLEQNTRQTETDATIKYNFQAPKYMLIQNDATKNAFGNPRSYRVLPQFMAHLTYDDTYYDKWPASDWLKHQVVVTKYKDDEVHVGNDYMNQDPFNPLYSFRNFFEDDESIVDEDLVMWVTLATHHIPHTENVPVTSTTGVTGAIVLMPFNYFHEEASMSSTDNIRTVPNTNKPGEHIYQEVSEDLPGCEATIVDPTKTACTCSGVYHGMVWSIVLMCAFIAFKVLN